MVAMRRTKLAFSLIALLGAASAAPVRADPLSDPVLLQDIRVYDAGAGSVVFVATAANTVCGTSSFKFNLNSAAGQGMLSVAMTALSARRSVVLDVASTGCAGWGTMLRSITLTTRPAA